MFVTFNFFSCEYICNHHYETLTFTDRVFPIDLLLKVEIRKAIENYRGTVEWFYDSAKRQVHQANEAK